MELEDDAAHIHMGGDWHMPSPTQIQELIDNTTSEWTISDEISGMTFTSKKDTSKSIFIPAAGFAYTSSIEDSGFTYVWASMLNTNSAAFGQFLACSSKVAILLSALEGVQINSRYIGYSIRGVIG